MAILIQDDNGWFISVQSYLSKVYGILDCENPSAQTFIFRKEFFQIQTPYLMNSSAVKVAANICNEKTKKKKDKKRKKNDMLKKNSLDVNSYIETLINERSASLIQTARELHYLENSNISSMEWFENNKISREAAKNLKDIELRTPFSFYNEKSYPIVIEMEKEEYILPAHSAFHLCDIINVSCLKGERYDLIVLDPPWENKSVRRNKKYSTLSCESLIDIPIEELCSPGCLIVIWVTNNEKQMDFIKKDLFRKWKVTEYAIWHWLKITQKGHFIHAIDWHHKKPYENLLLARIPFSPDDSKVSNILEPEPHKIIISVPSSIHSHKPPLVEVLKPYTVEQPKCLELFARYLLPGWTSLGKEVLKLQNTMLFEKQS